MTPQCNYCKFVCACVCMGGGGGGGGVMDLFRLCQQAAHVRIMHCYSFPP